MSDYRVTVEQSRKRLSQRYYVTIAGANGEKMFTSEMLKDKYYAQSLGHTIAGLLDANYIDTTEEVKHG